MGAVGKVTMDPDGDHLWAVIRCDALGFDVTPSRFGNECVDSDLDPVIKFDLDGKVVESFGSGLFIWPHGIDVDPDGNVWVTDAVGSGNIPDGDRRGHLVYKFSPTGDVLLRLGTPGMAGSGRNSFNSPSDVVVAPNGNVFIADGHNDGGNNRVMKFTSDGQFIMSWGQTGYAPGEFRALHAIEMDSRGTDLRRGPEQQPSPDLRSGRDAPGLVDAVRAGRAESRSTRTGRSLWPTRSRTTCRIRAGRWGSGSETPRRAG